MKVFISYSHHDKPFARYLQKRFQAIGIDVWLDESSQRGGEVLHDSIAKGVRECDHAVFLVTPEWMTSDHCQREVELFRRRSQSVARVPILRAAWTQPDLPAGLGNRIYVTWLDEDPDRDARFWEVFCAISGKEKGQHDTWSAQGRALSKSSVPPPRKPRRPPLNSLECDRYPQWGAVVGVTPEPSHDVLFVPGAAGQAHDHFSRRVREMLDTTPRCERLWIRWDKRPESPGAFRAILAEVLEVTEPELPGALEGRLTDSNLVLLHPIIKVRFQEERVIKYYTEWLPELLREIRPRMSLKCLQPVEWPVQSLMERTLIWLRMGGSHRESKREAEKYIDRVYEGVKDWCRPLKLQELANITEADLVELCQREKFDSAQKSWFLAELKSRNLRTSQEVFEAIDALLPEARATVSEEKPHL